MDSLTTAFNLILMAVICHVAWLWWEEHRTKKIFIIEDSEIDRLLLESRIKADKCKVTFFYSCEAAVLDIGRLKPDLVFIDHNLDGKVKGAELLKYCLDVKIKAFLVTGEMGAITGIDESYIIRKTYDEPYFARLRQLANRATT